MSKHIILEMCYFYQLRMSIKKVLNSESDLQTLKVIGIHST